MTRDIVAGYREKFIYSFSFVGITSTLLFGVLPHLLSGNYGSAFFELFLTSIAAVNLLVFHRTKNYNLASVTILFIMIAVLTFLAATGGYKGTGIGWIYTFPLLSFFMRPLKEAVFWNLALILLLLGVGFMVSNGALNGLYNLVQMRQYVGAYLAVFLLSLFYSYIVAKLVDTLKGRAVRDILTGLYNRAFLFESLERITEILRRDPSTRYCLVYLDLDRFKSVNDRFGHAEGDRVLQLVAGLIESHFRRGDIVARIGGDEFMVLVYECDPRSIAERLEILRKKIEAKFKDYGISISYGMVELPKEGLNVTDLVNLADRRMYEMKSLKSILK